eukprot:767328-Hanusia_phi.AAC.4
MSGKGQEVQKIWKEAQCLKKVSKLQQAKEKDETKERHKRELRTNVRRRLRIQSARQVQAKRVEPGSEPANMIQNSLVEQDYFGDM